MLFLLKCGNQRTLSGTRCRPKDEECRDTKKTLFEVFTEVVTKMEDPQSPIPRLRPTLGTNLLILVHLVSTRCTVGEVAKSSSSAT